MIKATVMKQQAVAMLESTRKSIQAAAYRGLVKGAVLVQKEARQLVMRGPKTGRLYGAVSDVEKIATQARGWKAASRRVHQASAAGEPPATDTGTLARSISVLKTPVADPARPIVYVQATAKYAKWLEYGTRKSKGHAGIKERPFLRPAVKSKKREVIALVNRELKLAVQRKSRD